MIIKVKGLPIGLREEPTMRMKRMRILKCGFNFDVDDNCQSLPHGCEGKVDFGLIL